MAESFIKAALRSCELTRCSGVVVVVELDEVEFEVAEVTARVVDGAAVASEVAVVLLLLEEVIKLTAVAAAAVDWGVDLIITVLVAEVTADGAAVVRQLPV